MEKKLRSIRVLEAAMDLTDGAERITEILRAHDATETNDWYMCVPAFFNGALDITLTERVKGDVWTQGPKFFFDRGDTLYNTQKAYAEWNKALQDITVCISVKESTPSSPKKTANGKRIPGSVHFSIMVPNKKKTAVEEIGTHTLTQDEFIRFLIIGPEGNLKEKISKCMSAD